MWQITTVFFLEISKTFPSTGIILASNTTASRRFLPFLCITVVNNNFFIPCFWQKEPFDGWWVSCHSMHLLRKTDNTNSLCELSELNESWNGPWEGLAFAVNKENKKNSQSKYYKNRSVLLNKRKKFLKRTRISQWVLYLDWHFFSTRV